MRKYSSLSAICKEALIDFFACAGGLLYTFIVVRRERRVNGSLSLELGGIVYNNYT